MGDIEKILDKMENKISKYADDSNYKETYALFRIGDIEELVDTFRMLNFKIKYLQSKIDKVNEILNRPQFEYDNIPSNLEEDIEDLKSGLKGDEMK